MDKQLISIRREHIDPNEIQGFKLAESKKLLLIQYIYDFNADGLMVLRKQDITNIETTNTDKFQTKLLQAEGVLQTINFDVDYDLSSWKNFIQSALQQHQYFIIEEEDFEEYEMTIGTIENIGNESVQMKYFSGTARWEDEPEEIKYADITSLKVRCNYINVYERYFQQQS